MFFCCKICNCSSLSFQPQAHKILPYLDFCLSKSQSLMGCHGCWTSSILDADSIVLIGTAGSLTDNLGHLRPSPYPPYRKCWTSSVLQATRMQRGWFPSAPPDSYMIFASPLFLLSQTLNTLNAFDCFSMRSFLIIWFFADLSSLFTIADFKSLSKKVMRLLLSYYLAADCYLRCIINQVLIHFMLRNLHFAWFPVTLFHLACFWTILVFRLGFAGMLAEDKRIWNSTRWIHALNNV